MGLFVHARFPIKRHEADYEAFLGDLFVLLLVLEDVIDQRELFCRREAENSVEVSSSIIVAEFAGFRRFLESVDEILELGYLVYGFGGGYSGGGGDGGIGS